MLSSLPSHALLVFWVQLTALLLAARLLGALARRLGQPAVVGELVAGLVLGPSVFGHLWPGGFDWFLPSDGGSAPLLAVTELSLVVLLIVIGAETDLRLIRRLGRAAASVSALSLAVPLAAGAGLALLLPASLIGPGGGRDVFVILMAGTVGVSSLPVIAKIVGDLGLVRRDLGQLAVAAGTSNDAVGFLLVALATGLARGAGSVTEVIVAIAGMVGISLVILSAGQRVFDAALRRVRRGGPSVTGSLGVSVVGALGAAAAMQAVGVEGALGAFVAGVALGRSRFQQGRGLAVLENMSITVFTPLYFASAGLRVDLSALGSSKVALSFVAVLAVAVVFKFVGAASGGWVARLPRRDAVALGVSLNGRGALQVIIGTAGLSVGALTTSSYTVVILMSLVTSIATGPILRRVVSGWEGTPAERERLGREEQLARNVVVRGQRLLLPSRGSPNSVVAAEVLAAAWPEESEATVLSVGADRRGDLDPVDRVLRPRVIERRHVSSGHVQQEIEAEAHLGYGVIGLGAAEEPTAGHLLSLVVDDLLTTSPIPLVVVRRARGLPGPLPPAFTRALVGVTGTPASRAGQEVACNLARNLGTEVALAHVVTRSDPGNLPGAERAAIGPRGTAGAEGRRNVRSADGAAQVVLRGAWSLAAELGVDASIAVRHGRSAGDDIVTAARDLRADLVVLGTTVRQVDGHPFLGHTVEHVLTEADATVVVVVLPEASSRLSALAAEDSTT